MAVKKILLIGNPELYKISETVTDFNPGLKNLVHDLKDTLIDFQQSKKTGRAIAAPQIGVLKKVIYANLPNRAFALINPEIIWRSNETFEVWDSCFSFDAAFYVKISRNLSIKVKYQDETGKETIETFSHDLSELLQHEIDHLHGILATDHLENKRNIILRKVWEELYKKD